MNNINNFLKHQIEGHKTPSVQYSFFDSDSIIYEFHDGVRNVKSKEPIDQSTTYHLYSVTKTFTALSVLQLVQSGKLALTDPVSDYVPEVPYPEKITVEQLLTHTSGIPNPFPLRWIHLLEEHESFDKDVFFKEVLMRNSKLKSTPGARFAYSNLGYMMLGELIERVSGESFEHYVLKNIVKRCGIDPTSLCFEIDPSVHATGYHKWWSASNSILGFLIDKQKFMGDREGKWKPFHYFYNNGRAFGGMMGSQEALITYAQALLKTNSVLLDDHHKDLLFSEKEINNRPTGMSRSWYTGALKKNRYYAHAGGGGGYYLELRVYPELAAGSVILFNRSGMRDERILDRTDRFFIAEK